MGMQAPMMAAILLLASANPAFANWWIVPMKSA
jgi:hypothetical protein